MLTHGFMGYHKEELNRAQFERALGDLGQDGFELSWMLSHQKLLSRALEASRGFRKPFA